MYEGFWIPELETLYVDIPKTASRAMLQVLQVHYGGASKWRGELPDIKFSYTVVRDPYARALSIWWAACFQEDDRYGFNQWRKSPAMMVNALAEGAARHIDLGFTQTQILEQRRCKTMVVIHYERLEEEFFKLPPFQAKKFIFPVVNRSPFGRPPPDCSPEFIEAVNRWCPRDFELGGYRIITN